MLVFFVLGICCINDLSVLFPLPEKKEMLPSFPVDQGLKTHCLRYSESLLSLTLFVRILAKHLKMQKNHRHIIWE